MKMKLEVKLLVLFISLVFSANVQAQNWFTGCIPGVVRVCGTNDSALTLTTGVTISNCAFSGCPSVSFSPSTNIVVNLINVTFINCFPTTDNSPSCLNFGSTRITSNLLNVTVTNSTNSRSSFKGFVYNAGPGNWTGLLFTYNRISATGGSALYIAPTSRTVCTGCNLKWNYGFAAGYDVNGGTLYLNGGSCQYQVATVNGGCFYSRGLASVFVSNFVAYNNTGGSTGGGFFYSNICNFVSLTDVYIARNYGPTYSGAFFSQTDANLTRVISEENSSDSDGTGINFNNNCHAFINNCTFRRNIAAGSGAGIFIGVRSVVTIMNNTFIQDNKAQTGANIFLGQRSPGESDLQVFVMPGVVITGGMASAGAGIYVNYAAYASITGAIITGNYATTRGGGAYAAGSTIEFFGNTYFAGNVASDGGGAIAAAGLTSTINIFDQVLIENNTAVNYCGGGVLLDSYTALTLNSPSITLRQNINIKGSEICAIQSTPTLRVDPTLSSVPVVIGTIWMEFIAVIQASESSFTRLIQGNLGTLKIQTRAVRLVVSQSMDSSLSLLPGSLLPVVLVTAIDYYGSPVFVQTLNPVLVTLSTTSSLPNLPDSMISTGDKSLAILDPSATVSFQGIVLSAPTGTYNLAISAIPQSVDRDVRYPWPNYTLNILPCPDGTRFLSTNAVCLPTLSLSIPVKYLLASLSVITMAFIAVSWLQLNKHKAVPFVKGNSFFFLSLVALGSFISTGSVALLWISPNSSDCLAPLWLDSIGFILSTGSVLMKTFRVQLIFAAPGKGQTAVGKAVQDSTLLKYLNTLMLILIIGLLIGSFMQPITPADILRNNQYYLIGYCADSYLKSTLYICKSIFILITAYYAYLIRDIPANFNESRYIAFSSYNWIIFGALVSLIGTYGGVEDIAVALLLNKMAIIIPNALTVFLLLTIKVYAASKNPSVSSSIQVESKDTFKKPNKPKAINSSTL